MPTGNPRDQRRDIPQQPGAGNGAQGSSREQTVAVPVLVRPGQMLGQYRVLEQLGAGGMGQVYKAIHPAMERLVALKVLKPELTRDADARARFQREVRSAARLFHPNVVVAYDAAEVRGLWFLVMEYVEGTDVARLFRRHGRPPLGMACEIVRQAALGLQHAHEQGMVHRDIKPANLIVAWDRPSSGTSASSVPVPPGWPEPPLVKILDFGLARLAPGSDTAARPGEALTVEGTVFGTPEFIAPEQARDSRAADIRSDIYSLGCVLYALLAGRPPFVSPHAAEVYTMHLKQAPAPVETYCPEAPPELARVVDRMLAKKPEDRYQAPREVAEALAPFAERTPSVSPRPSPVAAVGELAPAAKETVTISLAYLALITFAVMVISFLLMLVFRL
jgi:serine/threonine protein kinase